MVQINTDVSMPSAPAPINYSGYGEKVGKAIEGGAGAIGSILKAYKTVNDDMDKEKLKQGMLAEIKTKAPYILKYAKPNPTFEELSKSAYQVAVIGDLYDKAQQSIRVDKNGRPDITLAGKEAMAQMAFATDDKGFETMVDGLNKIISETDKNRKQTAEMAAIRKGAEAPGTLEEKVSTVLASPEYEGNAPTQAVDLLKLSGTKGKDILAAAAKKEAALIKSAADAARTKAKNVADALKRRGYEIKDRIAAEAVLKDYGKAISEHDDKVSDNIKGLKDLQASVKKIQDQANSAKANSNNAELSADDRATYRTKYEALTEQANQAASSLTDAKESIQAMTEDRGQLTDRMTIFVNDMADRGYKLAIPSDVENNPELAGAIHSDLNFGKELPPADTAAAPAPVTTTQATSGWTTLPSGIRVRKKKTTK